MELFVLFLVAAVAGGLVIHYQLNKRNSQKLQDTLAPYKVEPAPVVEVKETVEPVVAVEPAKTAVKVKNPKTKVAAGAKTKNAVKKQIAEVKTEVSTPAKKARKTKAK